MICPSCNYVLTWDKAILHMSGANALTIAKKGLSHWQCPRCYYMNFCEPAYGGWYGTTMKCLRLKAKQLVADLQD